VSSFVSFFFQAEVKQNNQKKHQVANRIFFIKSELKKKQPAVAPTGATGSCEDPKTETYEKQTIHFPKRSRAKKNQSHKKQSSPCSAGATRSGQAAADSAQETISNYLIRRVFLFQSKLGKKEEKQTRKEPVVAPISGYRDPN